MKSPRVLLFAPEGMLNAQSANAANNITVFFMIIRRIAQVVPQGIYWFLKASRTFSNSSMLEISTCLGFEPS